MGSVMGSCMWGSDETPTPPVKGERLPLDPVMACCVMKLSLCDLVMN